MAQQERLASQLETLVTDMRALQEHLRVRGLLDADWQTPSEAASHEVTPH
jgi:hypothetical protein